MQYAVETRDLTRDFDTVRALDGVNLEIPAGRVYGLLGPNGAGKTTTLHVLLGLIAPTKGTSTVAGFDPATHPEEVRARVGSLLEHHGLYERLSAEDNLEFYGRINRVPYGERRERIRALLDGIGLWDRRKETVNKWSKGMKQKLAIARTLLHRPPIILLDEPTAGHDPRAAAELRETVTSLVREQGLTALLTTHNLTEAEQLCGRIGILKQGRLVAQGTPKELRDRVRRPRVEIVTTGLQDGVAAAIQRLKEVASVDVKGDRLLVDFHGSPTAAPIVALLAKKGVGIEEVRKESASLEEAFLTVTEEGQT